jgi:hypothetical protein
MKRLMYMGLGALLVAGALAAGFRQDTKAISNKIGSLRSMPDDQRAIATRQLALDIRKLPSGREKLMLAESLANLSTERDFGRDTLKTSLRRFRRLQALRRRTRLPIA